MLDEGAHLVYYDPKVDEKQLIFELSNPQLNLPTDVVQKRVTIANDPYEAAKDSHAIIICTEWDEFKTLDYKRIYESMLKPAFVFDGRLILDHKKLTSIGFHVEAIGKKIMANHTNNHNHY